MTGLRRVIVFLGFILATVVARMIIEGPSPLPALLAALIIALLLGALRLRRSGRT
jgi:hypothetical protein